MGATLSPCTSLFAGDSGVLLRVGPERLLEKVSAQVNGWMDPKPLVQKRLGKRERFESFCSGGCRGNQAAISPPRGNRCCAKRREGALCVGLSSSMLSTIHLIRAMERRRRWRRAWCSSALFALVGTGGSIPCLDSGAGHANCLHRMQVGNRHAS